MKKVLGVLTLSVAMLVCATAAMAADIALNQHDITVLEKGGTGCNFCQKCSLQNVPCPGEETGYQGSKYATGVGPFDYDDAYGYCPNQTEIDADGNGIRVDDNKNGIIEANEVRRKCRLIFNVCDCPESCNLVPKNKVGIQMTILTAGVFWAKDKNVADGSNSTIWFQNYKTYPVEACAPAMGDLTNVNKDGRKNFGRIKYYRSLTEKVNDKKKLERVPTGEGSPFSAPDDPLTHDVDESVTGYYAGDIPPVNRVQVLESDRDYDYEITDADEGRCQFWIDIPAMRLDREAKAGDVIKVRVSLLTNRTFSGICSACEQPNICECVVSVGVVCCSTKTSTSGCMFFPYVLQGLQESQSWVSGVAISALVPKLPADAYCTLTLQDQLGNKATYTKRDLGNKLVWSFVLDDIMDLFDNKNMEPGATSLKVESNYRMDGYTFMNANFGFGTGAMPRACGESCNP